MDNPTGNLYTVYCEYEYEWREGLGLLNGRKHRPQIVADGIAFNDAAHIVRTLDEKGEPDMTYGMIPTGLFTILRHQIDGDQGGDNVCPKCDMLHASHETTCAVDGTPLPKAAPGSLERGTVERLFQRYLDIAHSDSRLAVDDEWTNEELFAHINTALNTED